MPRQFVQGDILFEEIENDIFDPSSYGHLAKPVNGRYIIARGEKTGHTHEVDALATQLFEGLSPVVLVVEKETDVIHQIHPPLRLPPLHYLILEQHAYTPARRVRIAD